MSQTGLWEFIIRVTHPSVPENQVCASQIMYHFKQCGPLGFLRFSWAVCICSVSNRSWASQFPCKTRSPCFTQVSSHNYSFLL